MRKRNGNVFVVLALIISSIALGLSLFIAYKAKLFSQSAPQPIDQKTDEVVTSNAAASSPRRFVYKTNNVLMSNTLDLKSPVNLTNKGVDPMGFFERMIISGNREVIFFVKNGNIFSIKTNGEDFTQITNNTSFDPEFGIVLNSTNGTGSKLLFSYSDVPGMYQTPRNNNIIYGLYLYDKEKYAQPKLVKGESTTPAKEGLLGFFGDLILYLSYENNEILSFNPDNGHFTKVFKTSLRAYNFDEIFVADKIAFYYTREDSSSALYEENYSTGNRKQITPTGTNFAEYQGLSISPDKKHYIYEHQVGIGDGKYRSEYYLYNTVSGTSKLLPIQTKGTIGWEDNETIVFQKEDPSNYTGNESQIYSYDIKNDTASLLINKGSLLLSNIHLNH